MRFQLFRMFDGLDWVTIRSGAVGFEAVQLLLLPSLVQSVPGSSEAFPGRQDKAAEGNSPSRRVQGFGLVSVTHTPDPAAGLPGNTNKHRAGSALLGWHPHPQMLLSHSITGWISSLSSCTWSWAGATSRCLVHSAELSSMALPVPLAQATRASTWHHLT